LVGGATWRIAGWLVLLCIAHLTFWTTKLLSR